MFIYVKPAIPLPLKLDELSSHTDWVNETERGVAFGRPIHHSCCVLVTERCSLFNYTTSFARTEWPCAVWVRSPWLYRPCKEVTAGHQCDRTLDRTIEDRCAGKRKETLLLRGRMVYDSWHGLFVCLNSNVMFVTSFWVSHLHLIHATTYTFVPTKLIHLPFSPKDAFSSAINICIDPELARPVARWTPSDYKVVTCMRKLGWINWTIIVPARG